MFPRWMVFKLFLLFALSGNSSNLQQKKSTMLSFDLRRKTKHHKERNATGISTPAPTTANEQEEIEFSLRSTSYAYVIELDLGTPPQRLEFLIDTGSSNMAIAGPECQDEFQHKCQIETFYYPDKSSTSHDKHLPIETEYGKGAWSASIYSDIVAFPGDGPKTTAEFAVISHEKDFFLRNSINEGILGLAYKSLATDNVEPLYDQLIRDNKVPNVFTLGLCNGMGKIWLDVPESSDYRGPVHYTSINQETWYSVTMTGIDVAGNSLGLLPRSFPAAIVDSGTTDILLELEIYMAVIAQLKERGPPVDERFWKNYCVDTDPYQWPYITIYLKDMKGGSFGLTVLGKHYVRKQDEFFCLSIGVKHSGAVLGEVVMEGNVVVFDRANQRIGFAPSNLSHPDVGPCGNPIRVNNTVKDSSTTVYRLIINLQRKTDRAFLCSGSIAIMKNQERHALWSAFLLGRLHKYCRAPDMPQETCYMGCKSCVKFGGVWCPKGHVVVWINGVRSVLSTKRGFCWPGGLFMFDDTKVQTFLTGHGGAEFQAYCDSVVPMYKQCLVEGAWMLFLSGVVFFSFCLLFLVVTCRKGLKRRTVEHENSTAFNKTSKDDKDDEFSKR